MDTSGHDASPHPRGEGVPTGSTATEAVDRLRFEALRCAFYHDEREMTFRWIDKVLSFMNIMLGSAAIASFSTAKPMIGLAVGFCVAAIGAAQLVWGFGTVSRDHRELKKEFYSVLSRIERGEPADEIKASLALLYAEEPPISRGANDRAHNRAGRNLWGDDFIKA